MKTLFLAYMIVEAIFGIGFLFAPALLMGPMGVTLDETSTTFARLFGTLILSIPVLFSLHANRQALSLKGGWFILSLFTFS